MWLDQEKSYVPDEPLAEATVFLKTMRADKRLVATRGVPATMTDSMGRFTFDGLIQVTENAQFRNCQLEAYGSATRRFCEANDAALAQFDRVCEKGGRGDARVDLDGSIIHAVDMAREKYYPYRIEIEKAVQHLNLVCFPC